MVHVEKPPKDIIPPHNDFVKKLKSKEEAQTCIDEFLQTTKSFVDVLEDAFELDQLNMPTYVSEEDRIFNSKGGFVNLEGIIISPRTSGTFVKCNVLV